MIDLRPLQVGAAAAALAGLAQAQQVGPAPVDATFPLVPTPTEAAPGVRVFEPDAAQVRGLLAHQRVRLLDVPTADGDTVAVDLERIDLERLEFGFQVDGSPAPGLLDGLDLSVWTGTVEGREGTEAVLSFSNRGVRGWLAEGDELTHLLAEPGTGGDWSRAVTWVVGERQLRELGVENDFRCGSEEITPETTPVHIPERGATAFSGSSTLLRECSVAIETDYQYNQIFNGDLAAQTAHVTALLAAGSDRYVEQIDTVLTYPYVQFYTSPGDPWSTPDSGGSTIDMLNEFVNAWSGNIPTGARLGHFLSGANLGGGVAYLDAICDTSASFSFAVSANLDGETPFPIAVGPFNWEFFVYTHELGHNFGSPHTHDYNPQIDDCAGGDCISDGTIMSYCHLCPGGVSNITTFFHPTVVGVMSGLADSCLPLFLGVEVAGSSLVAPNTPTSISADVQGSPANGVQLNYRFDPQASFTTVEMTDLGGGNYTADLPGAPCGSAPEYFVSFEEPGFGPVTSETVSIEVGVESVVFTDDFESANGWSVGAPGDSASTGVWERANPQSTAAQPEDDVTANGSLCFVTEGSSGGSLGANDIDGGATTLTSPSIDLSGGDARIGYWRWYSNDTGANPSVETFEIDISNDGGSSWTPVEVVGPTGGEASGGWFFNEFTVSDFLAPTADVRMRFVASDDVGAVVEAAIDDFRVRRVECTVCQPDLGFAGPGDLTLELCGDPLAAGGTADLTIANGAPNDTVFLVAGTTNSPVPFAGGQLVPNPQVLIEPLPTDGAGQATVALAGGSSVAVTVYLQAVGIDLALPEQLELSNALAAEYLP